MAREQRSRVLGGNSIVAAINQDARGQYRVTNGYNMGQV